MNKTQLVLVVGSAFFVLCLCDEEILYPTLNPNWSYCYEFTWFGPHYNNETKYNGTCEDYIDDTRAGENIPCIPPLVISEDGTLPDINYLWENHRASVLCIRSSSQVCVKYSYLLNGRVANQSHMCARVRTDGKELTNGCYTQRVNGYDVEVCICKSGFGLSAQPCNGSKDNSATMVAIIIGLLIIWFGK